MNDSNSEPLSSNTSSVFESLSQFDFYEKLENDNGLSLVFFSTDGCASCHYWEQLLSQYKLSLPDVTVYRVDAARDQALTEEFDIFHLPALFLFLNGRFHSEVQCEAKLSILKSHIDKLRLMPAQELP